MSRRHEEQQETELSTTERRCSQLLTGTRDYERQDRAELLWPVIPGFHKPWPVRQTWLHLQLHFFFFFFLFLLHGWRKQVVSSSVGRGGREAGQKKQLPLSGQTIIPLCFLVVVGSSLPRDENHLKDVSGFLGKCQSLFRFSWMLPQFHIWLVRKNGKREKNRKQYFSVVFLSVSFGN